MMTIRDTRLNKAINMIIKEELQRGNLPSSKEFLWRLNQYLKEHNPGAPEFQLRPVRKGSLARSIDYNTTLDEVYRDLETLYESTIDIHNHLSKNLSKFDIDKGKLEYEIKALENKLKELILLYGKTGFLNSVYDVFDDMNKVDPEKTTASVDIKNNEVMISNVKNTSTRITPQASVNFQLDEVVANVTKTQNITGTPSNALTGNVNEPWQQLIMSDYKQEVAGYFFINFKNQQMMNQITIHLNSIKPTYVRVEFTPDNINWFKLPYYEEGVSVLDRYTFTFPGIEMSQIRILLSKKEPDSEAQGRSDEVDKRFRYLIGMKEIEFYRLDFSEKADFYSLPLTVEKTENQNFSINKVSLLVDEEIPNGTDIQYSIALPPDEGKEPEWKKISPVDRENPKYDQIIDFKNIRHAPPMRFSIDPSISIGEYELSNLYANGINFYKIGEVEDKGIIAGSERLFVGANSWGVKLFAEQLADHDTHIPSLADWQKKLSNINYDYVKIQDGKPGVLLDKKTHDEATSYMFTLGVFSEKAKEVASAIPASTEPITIYMNGEKLFEGVPDSQSKINYLFKNGWNEIMVLCYTRDVDAANGVSLDLGFDPRNYGANIYSKAKPLDKVSLFDLRYNVKNNDRSKYAIADMNGKKVIILNHAVSGLEYDFYFHQIEGTVRDSILFKADFTRDRVITDISPKLKSYYLRFS